MKIDASERAELEQLRLATRLSRTYAWSYELGGASLSSARVTLIGATEALGYPELPSELGAVIERVVLPVDRARVLDELRACLEGAIERYESEYRVRRADGSVTWTLARGSVVRDDAGRPTGIAGVS